MIKKIFNLAFLFFISSLVHAEEELDYRFMHREDNNIHAAQLSTHSSSSRDDIGWRLDINARTHREEDFLLNDNYYVLGLGQMSDGDMLLKLKLDQPLNLNPADRGELPIYAQFDFEFQPSESNGKVALLIRDDQNEQGEYQTQYLIGAGRLVKHSEIESFRYLDGADEWMEQAGELTSYSNYLELGLEKATRLSRDITAMFGVGAEYHTNVLLTNSTSDETRVEEELDGGIRYNLTGGIDFAVHPSIIIGAEARVTVDRFGDDAKKIDLNDAIKGENVYLGVSASVAL